MRRPSSRPFTLKHWAFAGRQPVSTNVELLDRASLSSLLRFFTFPGSQALYPVERDAHGLSKPCLLELKVPHDIF